MADISLRERASHTINQITLFATNLFVDGNTVEAAIKRIKKLELLEETVSKETGAEEYFKRYKEANEEKKQILEGSENAVRLLRSKLYGFLMQGGVHPWLSLERPKYEISVDDISKIPIEYLTVDEDKVKDLIKKSDGICSIPGVKIEKKKQMVIRVKE